MTYHFFFERKKLILLLTLLALAGLVLFVAGILVGMRFNSAGVTPTLDPVVSPPIVPEKGDLSSGSPPATTPTSSAGDDSKGSGSGPAAAANQGESRSVVGDQSQVVADSSSAGAIRAEVTKKTADGPAPPSRDVRAALSVSEAEPPPTVVPTPLAVEDASRETAQPVTRQIEQQLADKRSKKDKAGDLHRLPEIFELQLSQVGSFVEAEQEVERWRAVGFAPYVVEVTDAQGSPRFTIRVGPFGSLQEALDTQERLVLGEGYESVLRFRQAPAGSKVKATGPPA